MERYARITLQARMELVSSDIDGIDMDSAMLQRIISKAASAAATQSTSESGSSVESDSPTSGDRRLSLKKRKRDETVA